LHSKSLRLLSPRGDILSLTRSECSLLQHLSDAAGACSYEELIDAIGSGGLNDKADKARLEVLVSRLRTKPSKAQPEEAPTPYPIAPHHAYTFL
jgi:DNA-binding response OmpR family regulator